MNKIDLTKEDSRSFRDELVENYGVFDKIQALKGVKDYQLFSTKNLAFYFDVAESTIGSLMTRNLKEFKDDEFNVYKGDSLLALLEQYPYLDISPKARNIRIFSKKGLLRVGMLLKRSKVACELRKHLTLSILEPENKNALVPIMQEEQLSFNVQIHEVQNLSLKEDAEADLLKAYIEKLELAGFTGMRAKNIALDCLICKKDINAILKQLVEDKIKFNFKVNSSLFVRYMKYMAENYYDNKYNEPYYVFSNKFVDYIGFDINTERFKTKNKKSFSDFIEEFDLWDEAIEVCQQMMDEYVAN